MTSTITLENGLLALEFDTRTGNLVRLVNLTTGHEILRNLSGARLAKLIAPTDRHMSRPIYSHQSPPPKISRHGDTLTIEFASLSDESGQSTGIFFQGSVRLPAGSREAFFSCSVRNGSPVMLDEIWFPWISGFTGVAGPGEDRCMVGGMHNFDLHQLLPHMRVHGFGRHHQRMFFAHPYATSVPVMHFSFGKQSALSCIHHGSKPVIGGFIFENLSDRPAAINLGWSWAHHAFVPAGQTWQSQEIGVGLHSGDLYDTLDLYRNSLRTWWRPPAVPARLKTAIGMHHIQLQGFNGELYHHPNELPAIAQDCLRYGIRDLCLWEMMGQTYLRPDDNPQWAGQPERLQALRTVLPELKRLGVNVNGCINLKLLTERNQLWKTLGTHAVQRSKTGAPYTESFHCSMNHANYMPAALEEGGHPLCQADDRFREYAHKMIDFTLDLGFTSFFIDQAFEFRPCFAPHHSHPLGDTLELSHRWYAETAAKVAQRDPEGYVVGEVPDVYNTRWIHLWWDWFERHHEVEVVRYALPENLRLFNIDEYERDRIAKAFATGFLLATATRNITGVLSDEPELAAQVSRLAKLRLATAPFVALGRFNGTRHVTAEGILAYSYESSVGYAVTLANSSAKTVATKISIGGPLPSLVNRSAALLHQEDGSAGSASLRETGAQLETTVTLPPYAAAVITLPYRTR